MKKIWNQFQYEDTKYLSEDKFTPLQYILQYIPNSRDIYQQICDVYLFKLQTYVCSPLFLCEITE